mmetsp:Transcript_9682/g.10862  ORF Transcript_9682/g.10862 Transcript_9682/m.10862 type:complete len:140 (+) Transcript_9682:31-450(+)
MNNQSASENNESEPPNPNLPPDKFKVPLPKNRSAFKPVTPKLKDDEGSGSGEGSSRGLPSQPNFSTYEYILRKALRGENDISDNEKMILRNHPVIVKLANQYKEKNISSTSYYIPIESILNYEYYHNAKIPILYDSREK